MINKEKLTLKNMGIEKFVTFPEDEELKVVEIRGREASELIEDSLVLEAINYASYLFPQIDPSFLSMKHKKQFRVKIERRSFEQPLSFKIDLPRFAIYTLESPICELEIGFYHDNKELGVDFHSSNIEGLPAVLFDSLMSPVIKSAGGRWGINYYGDRYKFTSLFMGLIPKDNKRRIETYGRLFKDKIYVVSEAENWEAKLVPTEDPLVIGVIHNQCYLLDQFNCTPIEHYARMEFKK